MCEREEREKTLIEREGEKRRQSYREDRGIEEDREERGRHKDTEEREREIREDRDERQERGRIEGGDQGKDEREGGERERET